MVPEVILRALSLSPIIATSMSLAPGGSATGQALLILTTMWFTIRAPIRAQAVATLWFLRGKAGQQTNGKVTNNLSDLIISNTANTITTLGLTHHSPVLTWSNGDSFKILRAAVCLDQRGRGKGSLISGDAPPWGTGITPQAWPNQEAEPTYVWNNTLNGSPFRVDSQNPWRMQEGRDFFNSAMPGYTPYTYPHPLTLAGGGDTTPPLAPRNLRTK